jgi:hypothetical protein
MGPAAQGYLYRYFQPFKNVTDSGTGEGVAELRGINTDAIAAANQNHIPANRVPNNPSHLK